MPIKCPIKQAANSAKYYEKNKEKVKLRAKIRTQKIRVYNRKLIARYKLWIGCKFCSYKRCNQALELHHVGTQKEQHVADMVQKGASTKIIKREIRRCIVVCANCHRELHEGMV